MSVCPVTPRAVRPWVLSLTWLHFLHLHLGAGMRDLCDSTRHWGKRETRNWKRPLSTLMTLPSIKGLESISRRAGFGNGKRL
ncbi:hypothetical protein CABS01_15602 [Colletotrichum abscissum]|uniref:uncharacterized protein n=1 Tax=Colletotrichum abscissum TaxID=1671311 RepID=UPI0027D6D6F4|nr:uncharacterized protein CABS01_15602 [Colletotrichum abscissum]KAK1475016.1 hypothetical protein CABS01_15602 [Colletotrichum abscissum]